MREIWKEEIKNSEFEMEEREEENKSMKEREDESMKERENKSMDFEQTCSVSFTIQHSLLFKHLPPALHLRRNT